MKFNAPTGDEVCHAIGALDKLPEELRTAFLPRRDFEPIPAPSPNDWLAVHPERGQTFDDFVTSQPKKPSPVRNTIYLQPLEDFETEDAPAIQHLARFASAFFAMPVEALAASAVSKQRITTRTNPQTRQLQLLTGDALGLLRRILPANAFCVLGITMRDLYPSPSWNFVFGEASLSDRVGVFSFARYDPEFYGIQTAERDALMMRRSCKVLAHETSHMFGIQHCIFFNCLMNGSNHLDESDRRPLHLCPVDLRKLHHSLGFDINQRYRALVEFTQQAGFEDERRWLTNRLAIQAA
jgi:archaemetzincin